nr:hypothetical protein [Halogeometricum pallidum]
MDGVGVSTQILEFYANQITFDGTNRRPRDLAVVCPGGELDTGSDSDRGVDRLKGKFANCPAVLLVGILRNVLLFATTGIELVEELVRVEIKVTVLTSCTEIPV